MLVMVQTIPPRDPHIRSSLTTKYVNYLIHLRQLQQYEIHNDSSKIDALTKMGYYISIGLDP